MKPKNYFLNPKSAQQRQYEALRTFYITELSAEETAKKYNFSPAYFKKLRFEFSKNLKEGVNTFFLPKKPGPKKRLTNSETVDRIISLRKQNYSVNDIKVVLDTENRIVSLETIDKILKAEGFAPLPKRTRQERINIQLPKKIEPPKSISLELIDEEFTTELNVGPLLFLPLIEEMDIVPAIKSSGFPNTSALSDVQCVLSFLALKLAGCKRWSHDTMWNMDRALGFFAGLNVLPKSTTLSTYSYRTTRSANRDFLLKMCQIFKDEESEDGEFNLDFKSIPHWGNESVLEKNWSGARSKSIKSLLSLIVQSPTDGNLAYTNAELKHRNQNDAVFDFIDFWKQGRGVAPKMLIFDSKFTTYKNLNKLNQSDENIKFLTLRRRGKNLVDKANRIPALHWQRIKVKRAGKREQLVSVHDGQCKLSAYKGEVRQIILKDHGREKPSFLITNDFKIDVRQIVQKYARRWLVEQEIAEQIAFFSLNNPSSSIIVKVDFDLTMSLLAHNLYREFSKKLSGFEQCNVQTINRKFLENGALIKVKENDVSVTLKKKSHIPILFESPWMKKTTMLSWMGVKINFSQGTTS